MTLLNQHVLQITNLTYNQTSIRQDHLSNWHTQCTNHSTLVNYFSSTHQSPTLVVIQRPDKDYLHIPALTVSTQNTPNCEDEGKNSRILQKSQAIQSNTAEVTWQYPWSQWMLSLLTVRWWNDWKLFTAERRRWLSRVDIPRSQIGRGGILLLASKEDTTYQRN